MMAAFHKTCVNVKIKNVVVSRCIAKENATEVVTVEFAASIACPFHADPGAKQFEICEIWSDAIIPFEWSLLSLRVYQPIM